MMMPVLLTVGPFKLYTLSLFLVLAFLWGGFVINKKASEYHVGDIEIYDGLVISMIVTAVVGKGLSLLGINELAIVGLWLGIILASLLLSKKEGVKLYTMMDIFSLGAILALSWWNMGEFWSGTLIGKTVNFPWGIMTGQGRVFPVELLSAVLYAAAFVWLWKVEKVYRTYTWYRGRKSSANTGFVFGMSLVLFGLINLVGFSLTDKVNLISWLSRTAALLAGVIIIYWQSGRVLRGDLTSIMNFVREKGRHKKSISVD